jgi:hypothetical protein
MLAYAMLLLALILLKLKWHVYTTFRFLMRRAPKVCPRSLNFDKSYIQFFGLFSIMRTRSNLVFQVSNEFAFDLIIRSELEGGM